MELVRKLAEAHYEEGNLARCYKQVWRRHVYPVYPMCYRTILNYLHPCRSAADPTEKAQPTLFDDADFGRPD